MAQALIVLLAAAFPARHDAQHSAALGEYVSPHYGQNGGFTHTLTRTSSGDVYAHGRNDFGQLCDGLRASRVVPWKIIINVQEASSGVWHNAFLKYDGTIWTCGRNNYGQLGDGTIYDKDFPRKVMSGCMGVSAGDFHTLFLKADGTAMAAGRNDYGQVGDGSFYQRSYPVMVHNVSSLSAVAAGGYHSVFLQNVSGNTTAWATGRNHLGQLGDGSAYQRLAPVRCMTDLQGIFAGEFWSLFVFPNGSAWSAGAPVHQALQNASELEYWSALRFIPDVSVGQR